MSDSMYVSWETDMSTLAAFAKKTYQLSILERKAPESTGVLFEKLMTISLKIVGKVTKKNALKDVSVLLDANIPAYLQRDPFYSDWVEDMAEICRVFCDIQGQPATGFWLGTQRGCKRYHVDNVPLRLLVTYAGAGTEWLPNEAADRKAFARSAPNEMIVTDPCARQFMNPWDIAVFRGGPEGLLHRTPDDALSRPSILLRLDHPSFWDKVFQKI